MNAKVGGSIDWPMRGKLGGGNEGAAGQRFNVHAQSPIFLSASPQCSPSPSRPGFRWREKDTRELRRDVPPALKLPGWVKMEGGVGRILAINLEHGRDRVENPLLRMARGGRLYLPFMLRSIMRRRSLFFPFLRPLPTVEGPWKTLGRLEGQSKAGGSLPISFHSFHACRSYWTAYSNHEAKVRNPII